MASPTTVRCDWSERGGGDECSLHGKPAFRVGQRVMWNLRSTGEERRGIVHRLSHATRNGWVYYVSADIHPRPCGHWATPKRGNLRPEPGIAEEEA